MAIRHVATLRIEDGIVQVSSGYLGSWLVELEFDSGLKIYKGEILRQLLTLSGLDQDEANRLMSGQGVFDGTHRRDQLRQEELSNPWLSRKRKELLRRQRDEMLEEEAREAGRKFQLDRELKQALTGASMRALLEEQEEVPLPIGSEPTVLEWLYGGEIYRANQPYTPEEVKLLIWERKERERRKLERLRKQMEAAGAIDEARRERIPEDVRTFVWRRDGGKCVMCGRTENLEYDHIIPVSKGGSSTANNVQLLCVECNRRKSDHI